MMQSGRDAKSFNCQPVFDGSNVIAVFVDAGLIPSVSRFLIKKNDNK